MESRGPSLTLGRCTRSKSTTSRSDTATSSPWTASRSPSRRARSSASSARTAPARRRPSSRSPACASPTAARSGSSGSTRSGIATHLRSVVGVQLQESELPDRITVAEAVELFASFYADPADPGALIEDLGLTAKRDTQYRKLSGGQKQRLSIALALVGKPNVAILDELSTGLDPQASPRDVAADRVDPRSRRDRPPRHAPDGGGRAPRRPGRSHRRRPDRRDRHTRRDHLARQR